MLQNYFILNRFIKEANLILCEAQIVEIFSQEKSKLIMVLKKDGNEYFLEFCVIPGNSFINVRKNYSRAKKNTLNFFDEILGERLLDIQIANDDRIIKISFSTTELIFTIRGKFSNVFIIKKDNIQAFKSVDSQTLLELKKEFSEKLYLNDLNKIEFSPEFQKNSIDEIRKSNPIIGSEITKELKTRLSDDLNQDHSVILNEILNEIGKSKPCVFIDENGQEIHLGFEKFISIPFTEKRIFESLIEAQSFLLAKRYFLQDKFLKEKLIRAHIERELKKVSSKLQNLQGLIERGSNEKEYNKYGKLLLTNLSSIKANRSSIEVEDIFSNGEKITIPLNAAISPQKNIDYYFNKSRSEKVAFSKSEQLFKNAKLDFEKLKKIEQSLNDNKSVKELDEIMNNLKIKQSNTPNEKDDLSSKFKHYIIEDKYDLYIGKDSKNNDLLTTKFAKQNDYWFHSRGSSGSHAVLRIHNIKEPVPKNILKKAASIAAFHSKAKTAGIVPVAYTFKKYVVKKKGDPVGTVHLLREDVLLVKPEIPSGCEYI